LGSQHGPLERGGVVSAEENKAIIQRLVEEVYNGDDLDVADEQLTLLGGL
jgi:hypothetical protein